jgi:tRNA1(Val) A37 N6-methylase TrmN6
MRTERPQDDLTDDAVLGGRLRLWQPRRGHRFGHDAILLAAATAAHDGDIAVDLGAGIGTAGLAVAMRVPGLRVRLVDIDPHLTELAAENARRNGLADRVTAVNLDVDADANTYAAACLGSGGFDVVLMNPPFNDPDRQPTSPDPGRRLAHSYSRAGLSSFLSAAARLLRVDGILTTIYRVEGVGTLLSLLPRGFGAITLMPVHPKPDAAAIRVIIRAVKASRAPPAILPGLLLAHADGRPSEAAEAILREGATLPLAMIGAPRRRSPRTRAKVGGTGSAGSPDRAGR